MFLNQEINPTTTSNPESKSKSRLNIKDIKPRIKEQTQQRHFPLFEIQTQQISKLVIQILHKHLPRLTIPSANKNRKSKALNLFTKTIPRVPFGLYREKVRSKIHYGVSIYKA